VGRKICTTARHPAAGVKGIAITLKVDRAKKTEKWQKQQAMNFIR
jgi:hypothetical protein